MTSYEFGNKLSAFVGGFFGGLFFGYCVAGFGIAMLGWAAFGAIVTVALED